MTHSRLRGAAVSLTVLSLLLPAAPGASAAPPAPSAPSAPSTAALALQADFSPSQWALRAVRAKEAWAVSTGAGQTVAVIDTGVDATHPDLAGQLVDGAKIVAKTNSSGAVTGLSIEPQKAADTTDFMGHGTHVSGIIAAKDDGVGTTGVAPGAKVMPVAFDESLDSATPEQFYTAIAKAIDYARRSRADVISMSLGSPALEGPAAGLDDSERLAAQELVCNAVAAATLANIPVVVAAGNDGMMVLGDGDPASIPASCPGAISVAASDPRGKPAFFSSSDPTVTIAAPGYQVLSTFPTTSLDPKEPLPEAMAAFPYAEMTGTSMAAPMVAGIAALIRSAHPGWTAEQVRQAIVSTATDIAPAGPDPESGAGLVDAAAAVGAAPARAEIPPSGYLSASVRRAVTSSAMAFTAWWSVPTTATLPASYSVSVLPGMSSDPAQVISVPGNQVRASFQVSGTPFARRQFWVLVTAHYADGTSLAATPQFVDARREEEMAVPQGVKVRAQGDKAIVTWKPLEPGSATGIGVSLLAPLADDMIVALNPDGTDPGTAALDLPTGILDPLNAEITVSVYPVAGPPENPDLFVGEGATATTRTGSPLYVYSVAPRADGTTRVDVALNSSFRSGVCAKTLCDSDRVTSQVRVQRTVKVARATKVRRDGRWQTVTVVSRKKVWRSYTVRNPYMPGWGVSVDVKTPAGSSRFMIRNSLAHGGKRYYGAWATFGVGR